MRVKGKYCKDCDIKNDCMYYNDNDPNKWCEYAGDVIYTLVEKEGDENDD